ncbi:MAG TPA: type II toxin-antitoxin system Phd/YefM family antitoxin [Rhizomicrobium sp.]
MAKHSVAEAKNRLPELIDLALKGEEVVITRHGHPVAELKAVVGQPKVLTDEELDRLAERRVGRVLPKEDAGTCVSRMRDEEWNR